MRYLEVNDVHCGASEDLIGRIAPGSVSLSVWSPPYHVGKNYEKGQSLEDWVMMLKKVVAGHFRVLKPGGFMVVNIADILCFPDPEMPRIQLPNPTKQRCKVSREDILSAKRSHPDYNRYQLAALLKCSEQTIDRRLNGNNIRGGKYHVQTRIQLVGSEMQNLARDAGLFLYDRRIWKKDAAWQNSQWHSGSYRSVDEFEYLYFFWKPGETIVDRDRLAREEWVEWGSRAVWEFPSVRANDRHEAMFPKELPLRCIRLLTEPGEIVLDPFMGSGTTGIAAVECGRQYVGIDKEPKYVELARKSIRQCEARASQMSLSLSPA